MTNIIATLIDAAQQLRIQRVRVLLSLFGVGVAIACLTAAVALGTVVRQVVVIQMESQSGRPATIAFTASQMGEPDPAKAMSNAELTAAFYEIADRYDIRYASANSYYDTTVAADAAPTAVALRGVGPRYDAIHRVELLQGRWLDAHDAERLAPVVVVNQKLMDTLAFASVSTHPVLKFADGTRATVIGVVPDSGQWDNPTAYMLNQQVPQSLVAQSMSVPQFEVWVPEDAADDASSMVARDLRRATNMQVDATRMDYAGTQSSNYDPMGPLTAVLVGTSVAILLLGLLSLVNISVVTVRYRVREIGIRRAFGASRGRVFFGIMLESVVGTFFAGVVAVAIVIALYRLPFLATMMSTKPENMPPFPVDAAIAGIVVAVVVGALAGAIPALIAVRSKVIDAIRF